MLVSVLLNAAAQIFLKKYAIFTSENSGSKLSSLMNVNLIIAGLCYASSIIFWISALRTVKLSYAYPFQSLGYVLVGVLSIYVFREKITIPHVVGLIVIVLGVAVMSWGMK